MAEGSGSKVAIGCCSGIAVVIGAALMVSVIWGKKLWTFFETAAEEQSELIALVEEWEDLLEGTAKTPQEMSPPIVESYARKEQSQNADAPGFSVGATG